MELKCESLFEKAVILRVTGRVDAITAPDFEKALISNLTKAGNGCVLDLSQADYMSSAGLRVLVLGVKTAKTVGSSFMICSLQDGVREILDTVGFIPLLSIYPDETSAKSALQNSLNK